MVLFELYCVGLMILMLIGLCRSRRRPGMTSFINPNSVASNTTKIRGLSGRIEGFKRRLVIWVNAVAALHLFVVMDKVADIIVAPIRTWRRCIGSGV